MLKKRRKTSANSFEVLSQEWLGKVLSLKVASSSRKCIKVKQMEPTAKWIKCSFNLHYLSAGVTLEGSRCGAGLPE